MGFSWDECIRRVRLHCARDATIPCRIWRYAARSQCVDVDDTVHRCARSAGEDAERCGLAPSCSTVAAKASEDELLLKSLSFLGGQPSYLRSTIALLLSGQCRPEQRPFDSYSMRKWVEA